MHKTIIFLTFIITGGNALAAPTHLQALASQADSQTAEAAALVKYMMDVVPACSKYYAKINTQVLGPLQQKVANSPSMVQSYNVPPGEGYDRPLAAARALASQVAQMQADLKKRYTIAPFISDTGDNFLRKAFAMDSDYPDCKPEMGQGYERFRALLPVLQAAVSELIEKTMAAGRVTRAFYENNDAVGNSLGSTAL